MVRIGSDVRCRGVVLTGRERMSREDIWRHGLDALAAANQVATHETRVLAIEQTTEGMTPSELVRLVCLLATIAARDLPRFVLPNTTSAARAALVGKFIDRRRVAVEWHVITSSESDRP